MGLPGAQHLAQGWVPGWEVGAPVLALPRVRRRLLKLGRVGEPPSGQDRRGPISENPERLQVFQSPQVSPGKPKVKCTLPGSAGCWAPGMSAPLTERESMVTVRVGPSVRHWAEHVTGILPPGGY